MKDKLHALLLKLGLITDPAPEAEAEQTAALAAIEQRLTLAEVLKGALGKLAAALSMDASATPEDIINAAIDEVADDDGEMNAMRAEKEAMETELNAARAERARHALAPCLASGAVSKAQHPAALARLSKLNNAEFAAALAEINAAAPTLRIGSTVALPMDARRKLAQDSDRRTQRAEINAKVEAVMTSKKIGRTEALAEVKVENPEFFTAKKTDV